MKLYFECKYGEIYHGDCLDIMPRLGVKVDAVITDPPYGTTASAWDSVIPFADMWAAIDIIRKDNTAVCLFGAEPFSSALRMSNIKQFKYDWIWDKIKGTGFLNAKKQPMRNHEIISVFYKKQPTYNALKTSGHNEKTSFRSKELQTECYGEMRKNYLYCSTERYPRSIQTFPTDTHNSSLHVNQKPIDLLKYIIKTYTNEDELVLDFTCGSGTAAVAAINTSRRFIGIELEEKYCEIAAKRIEQAMYGNSLLNL